MRGLNNSLTNIKGQLEGLVQGGLLAKKQDKEKQLIEKKILSDPSVLIRVREYNSKHITILGQVPRVGSYPFTPGLTLVRAISMAGGFNAIAKKDHVALTRKTKGRSRTVYLSVDAIMEGSSPDVELQPGDQIYVQERIF